MHPMLACVGSRALSPLKWILIVLLAGAAWLPISGCSRRDTPADEKPVEPPPNTDAKLKERFQEWATPQGHVVRLSADHDPWADAVVSFRMGSPAAKRSINPWAAVGKPDYKKRDDAEDEKTYVALGQGGELVLEFLDNALVDGPGPDLVIFEIGDAVEPTHVAVSEDGKTWIDVGLASGSKSMLDIGPLVRPDQRFRFVRLIDAEAKLSSNTAWPGADIDTVGALHSRPVPDAPSRAEIEKHWKK